MTSHAGYNSTTRDSPNSSASPIERRTTSSTFSGSNQRHSIGSNDTGESSTAASNRDTFATSTLNGEDGRESEDLATSLDDKFKRDSKSNHRSHNKNRSSGGFLLSNSLFHRSPESPPSAGEHLPRSRGLLHDLKGKSTDKKNKRHSSSGAAGSPLASSVTSAPTTQNMESDSIDEGDTLHDDHTQNTNLPGTTTSNRLDVDSAQIVNLALNLSESRRIASRRNISTPLPLGNSGLGDVGGSLRQHLQQQRRASRNISPKPDRHDRALTHSSRVPSGLRLGPSPEAFDVSEGSYQYHFSSSTLARAEKAKKAIELMAQYRRLLQYVPPLKAGSSDRLPISAPGPNSNSSATAPTSLSEQPQRVFGREYNPLQYIRNRKVRARARIAIDGEAQEFGNVHKVSWWVDEVSKAALSGNFIDGNRVALPPFSKAIEDGSPTHTSPQSIGTKGQTVPKVTRPRIDWVINPADMIADIFWLEQGDNKTLIEDRLGRPIFPRMMERRQSIPRRLEDSNTSGRPPNKKHDTVDLRIDTKLPDFRSLKQESDKYTDSTTSRMRHKFHEAAHKQHRRSSSRERSHFLRSRSRSDSDSSDSDHVGRFYRRRRSGTMDSQDRGRDILEKQMLQMLAKESGSADWMTPNKLDKQNVISSIETPVPNSADKSDSSVSLRRRFDSKVMSKESPTKKRPNFHSTPSGRPSLEVPGMSPRNSLEGLDTTAPNSPLIKASKLGNSFPGIALDLSSPRSRRSSPSRRRPLSRVRSKINLFREHSRDRGDERDQIDRSRLSIDSIDSRMEQTPDTPNGRNRSISPTKKLINRGTDESTKLKKQSSLRRSKGEESSGIRGLFKGSRGPVARVSDFLWKKDSNNSAPSTDDSDTDDYRPPVRKAGKRAPLDRQDTEAISASISPDKSIPTYIDNMPVFKSPLENRGRSTETRKPELVTDANISDTENSSKVNPRIDIHRASPTSSPSQAPADRRVSGISDVSDVSTRRGSNAQDVRSADARLNAILGYPGHILPVTGLSVVEASQAGRPSINGKRQWSISDSGVSVHRGPMTKREIARARTILLSIGIKANELTRRATVIKDLRVTNQPCYKGIASLTDASISPVPKSQLHIQAARIIRDDTQFISQLCHQSANDLAGTAVQILVDDMGALQNRLVDNLTPMTRKAADEADEVSKDLVTSQILEVNKLTDSMEKMMRRRRRRFRWVRRGGWVMVEWALVGVMWYVWFMVVLARVVMGIGRGAVGAVRWLFWL